MILLIDVGNTRIKWAAWQGGAWQGRGAFPVDEPERLAPVLADRQPGWVGVACVAGAAVRSRVELVLAGFEVFWLASAARGDGIVSHYQPPQSLGADRYAGLIACWRLGLAPCVLASSGTALTVDALTGEGEFLGGMIVPGIALMRRALAGGTAEVASLEGEWQAFPRSTGAAVTSGIGASLVGAVESLRGRLAERCGQTITVVVTGGDAETLAPHLAGPVRIEHNLVLEGLLWLARDRAIPGV